MEVEHLRLDGGSLPNQVPLYSRNVVHHVLSAHGICSTVEYRTPRDPSLQLLRCLSAYAPTSLLNASAALGCAATSTLVASVTAPAHSETGAGWHAIPKCYYIGF